MTDFPLMPADPQAPDVLVRRKLLDARLMTLRPIARVARHWRACFGVPNSVRMFTRLPSSRRDVVNGETAPRHHRKEATDA